MDVVEDESRQDHQRGSTSSSWSNRDVEAGRQHQGPMGVMVDD